MAGGEGRAKREVARVWTAEQQRSRVSGESTLYIEALFQRVAIARDEREVIACLNLLIRAALD